MTARPGYEPPRLKDLVLIYVAFDILILDGRDLCSLPLSVGHKCGSLSLT